MPARLDLTGQRFGQITALSFAGVVRSASGNEFTQWRCRCDCGKEFVTFTNGLRSGHAKSCGCLGRKNQLAAVTTHGLHLSATYSTWSAMMQRCTNAKTYSYENYGGRGIRVCERWQRFENFLQDMGQRPEHRSLDRIDNNGNYEPCNCRWATRKEQDSNKRRSVHITHDGRTQTITAWCRELGLSHNTVKRRLRVFGTLTPSTNGVPR